MKQKLRVGLVGAGMISAFHLKAWASIPDLEVIAIADPDPARAAMRADEFGIPNCYPNLDALLAAEEVDALDIASPRETHAALVRQAAGRGVAVLCQKPLAPTLAEAEALVRDAEGRVPIMVHENWRFRPYYRQIKAWIADGLVGQLGSASISLRSSGLLPDGNGQYPSLVRQPFFRTERRLLIAETLIHQIDVMRWLFGPLGFVGARLMRSTDAVIGETVATILLETESGAPVLIDGNMTCPGFPASNPDRVELIGSKASVIMATDRLQMLGGRSEDITYSHAAAYQESFDGAIRHFVHGLRTGAPFETNLADNIETLRLVEAAYESAGPGYSTP